MDVLEAEARPEWPALPLWRGQLPFAVGRVMEV
jgi:hypothetical protein